jgi:hypothetical protein
MSPRRQARNPPSVRRVDIGGAHPEQIMHEEAGRKIETPVEARAGFLDRPVLVVLCVSLALIVTLFAVLWLGFFHGSPGG